MKEEKLLVKCERCGRIRPLFQYTRFDKGESREIITDNGSGSNPRFTTEQVLFNDSKGLCEECGVEFNKRLYDNKFTL